MGTDEDDRAQTARRREAGAVIGSREAGIAHSHAATVRANRRHADDVLGSDGTECMNSTMDEDPKREEDTRTFVEDDGMCGRQRNPKRGVGGGHLVMRG